MEEKYIRPIRKRTKILFVYCDKRNHEWLKTHLKSISASEFVNSLITLIRIGDHDFRNILPLLDARRQNKDYKVYPRVATRKKIKKENDVS